jgi:murein DD-endopeptidase MepM/ murein hydrolase activator NlpD
MQCSRVKLAPFFIRLAVPLGLILLATGLSLGTRNLEAYNESPYPLPPTLRFHERATLPTEASGLIDQARIPVEFRLMRGETVTQVFQKLGMGGGEAREATNALAEHVNLRALKAGNHYSAFLNPDSSLASLEMNLEGNGRVEMKRQAGQWAVDWLPYERSVRLRVLRGTLDGSLDLSIRRAGGPIGLAYRMADVLQWDLDFTRDLKRGDTFEILYEEVLLDGQPHAVGAVYALSYENDGKRHEVYRYGDSGTYYDGEGRPLKKMFLRSPLRYSRITSTFSQRRFHPVLKEFRPHYGVDYGAPIGTPVQVTANGIVAFVGSDRGGGNVVKVQHPGGYTTAYLHLSRFGAGIRPGARVHQGDIIAFTGMTGLATGPHLDYRVQYRGQWIDPLTLKSVREEPIPQNRLASFRSWRNEMRSSLDRGVVSASLRIPGDGIGGRGRDGGFAGSSAPRTRYAVNPGAPAVPAAGEVAR